MATVRVFPGSLEEQKIRIAGEEFELKALPSGKVSHLQDIFKDVNDLGGLLSNLAEDLEPGMSTAEELNVVVKKFFDKRYQLISFALGIPNDSEDYKRLKTAIDDADFPQIAWVIDQILEINGVKRLEKMMKNLWSEIQKMIPDFRDTISHWLKQYTEDSETRTQLMDRLKNIRDTGSTTSSSDSPENLTILPTPSSSKAARSTK